MTVISGVIAISLFCFFGLILLAIVSRPPRWIAFLGLALVVIFCALDRLRLAAAPVVIVTTIVVALIYRRARHGSLPSDRHRRWWSTLFRFGAILAALAIVCANSAALIFLDPLLNDPMMLVTGDPVTDLSRLPWPDAFEAMSQRLSRAYAFGAWKKIDWKRLHDETAPRIAAAARANDRAAYDLALRQYLWSLHDGHVGLRGDNNLRRRAIAGGFGLTLVALDDGRIIVSRVLAHGAAAGAGVKWGAEVRSWNDADIDAAIAQAPIVWNDHPLATRTGIRLAQLRWLLRAPVGTRATLTFVNPGESTPHRATLRAADDDLRALESAPPPPSKNDEPVTWRMLDGKIGYVKIRSVMPSLKQLLPDRAMGRAVEMFRRAGARGVIVDVRGNQGGADKLATRLMGFFLKTRRFYESGIQFDDTTGRFERVPAETLWTEPRTPTFDGPLALLIDEYCISSCEGLALIAQTRPDAHVVGFHATYGSFGMSGAQILMPGSLIVEYPYGQSLDARGVVQIDSDAQLRGGIEPDVRVPVTLENMNAESNEHRDVVLEQALRRLTRP